MDRIEVVAMFTEPALVALLSGNLLFITVLNLPSGGVSTDAQATFCITPGGPFFHELTGRVGVVMRSCFIFFDSSSIESITEDKISVTIFCAIPFFFGVPFFFVL